MRSVIFSSVLLSFVVFTHWTGAQEENVSPAVQSAINKIKSWDGQYTLTPENTLKSITFTDGAELDEEAFELFAEQTDLESLQITNCRDLNDAAVAQLTGLKKLKTLWLINGVISDAAIKTIADSFPDLISLDVSRNARLTDASAREIAKLKELQVLGLRFCDFSELGIISIATLPKLRALEIRGNMQIGDGGMGILAKVPTLRSLKHRAPVSDAGLRALAEAKSLDHLEIEDFLITGQSGHSIRQLDRLTSLIIFRCENFDSTGVLELKGLKLNRLTLRGLPIDDSAIEVFSDLTTLRRLYLQELPGVSDAGIVHLASLKNLETLDILGIPMTDTSMETIAKLTSLKTLWIRATDITDKGLDMLLTLPNLETVLIQGNERITPSALQKLKDAGKFKVE